MESGPSGSARRIKSRIRLLPDKRGAGPGHLKLRLSATAGPPQKGAELDAIGFGLGASKVEGGSELDAAFQLSLDSWNGLERLQLKLKDVRPA